MHASKKKKQLSIMIVADWWGLINSFLHPLLLLLFLFLSFN